MQNKEFANVLALATEKGKISKSKVIAQFIEAHEGNSNGELNLDGEITPEIEILASKIPHNLKINEPTIKEVLLKAAEQKTSSEEPKTRTTKFKAQEW